MTGVAWSSALKPRDFGYHLIETDVSGGAALAGGEQFVFSPGPRWGASMTLLIQNKEMVLAVRSLRAQLKGRAVPVQLPNFDGKRLSWPVQIHETSVSGSGVSTGVVLTPRVTRNRALDGTIYADPEIPTASEILATVNTNAALRATTLLINKTQGEALIAGQQFGIGERLYEIATITGVAGAVTTVTLTPPLRAAAVATTVVKFTRPICLMRCLNLNEELRKLELMRFATLNLEFAEYL